MAFANMTVKMGNESVETRRVGHNDLLSKGSFTCPGHRMAKYNTRGSELIECNLKWHLHLKQHLFLKWHPFLKQHPHPENLAYLYI